MIDFQYNTIKCFNSMNGDCIGRVLCLNNLQILKLTIEPASRLPNIWFKIRVIG